MEKKYNLLFKGKRVEFPLATGAATYVSLIYDEKKNPYLLCWVHLNQEKPEFTVALKGCKIINNITEIGPCIHIITANEEYQFQCRSKEEYNEMSQFFNMLRLPILGFKNVYVLNKKIGKGSFSTAYIGTNILYGNRVVVKEVNKSKVKESNIYTEIEVLRKVVHKYIIKLISAYEQEEYVYLVLEYLKGGELFEYLNNNGVYPEHVAKKAIKRILIALETLHSNGVVHRDLKMENLMLENPNDPTSLKIIDFGLASFLNRPSMNMRCGSPGYVAPEILKYASYGTKVDIFSLGVILFNILCGYPPFIGNNVKEIFKKNMKCHINFNTKHWMNKSENVKNIILWMCNKNPDERCTAMEALRHPWFLPKSTDTHISTAYADLRHKEMLMQKALEKELCKKCKYYNVDSGETIGENDDEKCNRHNCNHSHNKQNNDNNGRKIYKDNSSTSRKDIKHNNRKYFDTMLKFEDRYANKIIKKKNNMDSFSINKKDYDMCTKNTHEYEPVVLHGNYNAQTKSSTSVSHKHLKREI